MVEFNVDSLKAAVESVGVVKIAAALVLLLVVVGVFLFFPRSGKITVQVSELDGGAFAGAEVSLLNSNGESVDAQYSNEGGKAVFEAQPGDYDVSVDAGTGFKPASGSVSLASGGAEIANVEVARVSQVSVSALETPSEMPLSCEKTITFSLHNSGARDENVQLVADGGLKGAFTAPSAIVSAGGDNSVKGTFKFAKGKIGDSLKGRVRPSGSRDGVDFSFVLSEAPKVTVSPGSITGSVAVGEFLQKKITVENQGGSDVSIPKDAIIVEGDYAGSYEWSYFKETVPAHGSVSWWLVLIPPEGKPPGKLVGSMTIQLPCKNVYLDIDTDLTAD